jgi:hypothetical protein
MLENLPHTGPMAVSALVGVLISEAYHGFRGDLGHVCSRRPGRLLQQSHPTRLDPKSPANLGQQLKG